MSRQSAQLGRAELTRAADIVNTGLTEMRGATAPRLLLELICARVLLPAVGDDEASLLVRLERLERRFAIAGDAATAGPSTASHRGRRPSRAVAAALPPPALHRPAPVALDRCAHRRGAFWPRAHRRCTFGRCTRRRRPG